MGVKGGFLGTTIRSKADNVNDKKKKHPTPYAQQVFGAFWPLSPDRKLRAKSNFNYPCNLLNYNLLYGL